MLLLLSGLLPTRLHALDDGDAPSKGATITTVLYPGWNMAGWVGPETHVSDLFEAVPELVGVLAWDADAEDYRRYTKAGLVPGARPLMPGVGLWLKVSGEAPLEWVRGVSDEYVLLSLRTGWNLVGWTGGDSTPIEEALARLGDGVGGAVQWDAEMERYTVFYPDAETITDLRELNRGDALWVYVVREVRWAHPGTGRVVFEFADEIQEVRRAEIRDETESVMAFFAERLGVYRDDLMVSVPYTAGCWANPDVIKLNAHPGCIGHEYFHALQYALAQSAQVGPSWLTEGVATYMEELYDEDLEWRRRIAPAGASHATSIRPGGSGGARLAYHLGFIAADWLIAQAGEHSLLNYYRLLPSAESWEEAFAEAFGLSLDEFYEAFEAHRAEVAPPLPHLTDELVRPVAVFSGDVSPETRARIQGELDDVHNFLVERFGAEPSEFSVYVGSDWEAVAHHARRLSGNLWWDNRVRRFSLPLEWRHGCSIGVTNWLVHALDCGLPLDHQSLINSHIRPLLEDREQASLSPMWIEAGGAIYLGLSFASGSLGPLDDELARYAGLVQQSSVQLEELAPTDTLAPKGPWEGGDGEENAALSVLAVDWLLRHAGEHALFEYFRLLPEGGHRPQPVGWQSAFETAFGLTIGDFYEQFDAYRATSAAP